MKRPIAPSVLYTTIVEPSTAPPRYHRGRCRLLVYRGSHCTGDPAPFSGHRIPSPNAQGLSPGYVDKVMCVKTKPDTLRGF